MCTAEVESPAEANGGSLSDSEPEELARFTPHALKKPTKAVQRSLKKSKADKEGTEGKVRIYLREYPAALPYALTVEATWRLRRRITTMASSTSATFRTVFMKSRCVGSSANLEKSQDCACLETRKRDGRATLHS